MTPELMPTQPPEPAGLNEFARITGVFFEPKKAFEDIGRRPRWFVPTLLVAIACCAFFASFGQRVGWGRFLQQQMETNPSVQQRMSQVPPEQMQRTLDMQAKVMGIAYPVGPLVGVPIAYLISAGLLMLVATGMMGAGLKFKQMFAITAYSGLPQVLKWILAIVVLFLKDPEQFNLQNPLAFNPAAFMDPLTTDKFVYTLASSLDVFVIWGILLTAVGISAAAGKRMPFGKALTAVLIPSVLFILLGATVAKISAG